MKILMIQKNQKSIIQLLTKYSLYYIDDLTSNYWGNHVAATCKSFNEIMLPIDLETVYYYLV